MQDNRPPIVIDWIKAEKQRDPLLGKLLEVKLTSLFVGEKEPDNKKLVIKWQPANQ